MDILFLHFGDGKLDNHFIVSMNEKLGPRHNLHKEATEAQPPNRLESDCLQE
jgi:hypothetical protein